jgi:aerobic carbon-monoxide dehydrogenase medium subunit
VKLPPFEYHLAESVDEAIGLLAEFGDEAKVLAGGQSLVPLMAFRLARPAHLIDVNALADLAYITDGNGLEIGATVRHREAERSDVVIAEAPMLASALRLVGHTAIRNRGTVGGSIAHADPAAEMPAVLTALDGQVVVRSTRGERTIDADTFIQGFLTTDLEADELVTAIRLPPWPASTGWAFDEFSRRNGDFAIVGVATMISLAPDGRVGRARLVFSGVGGTPMRAVDAETAMVGETPSPALWAAAADQAAAALDPPADLHGSPAYRRQLARVLAARSLQQAYERAKGTL